MIGFGNMAEPDFASSPSGNVAEKYPPAGGMGGLGFTPVSAFVIQMLCLQLRRLWRQGLCGAGAPLFTLLIYWKAVAVLAANALPRDPREKRRQRLLSRYFIIGCEAPSYGLLCFKLNSQV